MIGAVFLDQGWVSNMYFFIVHLLCPLWLVRSHWGSVAWGQTKIIQEGDG